MRGSGIVQRAQADRVDPPGVDDGTQIRLGGEGEPGQRNGPSGDLYVVLHVTPHEFFKRRNSDIILEVSINVAQAALGDSIRVPTVDGDEEVAVPAGTQSGKVIRLRGKGVPKLRRDGTTSGRGDQLLVITVDIPTKLTKEQRELFEELSPPRKRSRRRGRARLHGPGGGLFRRDMSLPVAEHKMGNLCWRSPISLARSL